MEPKDIVSAATQLYSNNRELNLSITSIELHGNDLCSALKRLQFLTYGKMITIDCQEATV